MAASYPTSVKTWTAVVDNVDDNSAADINELYEEVISIETNVASTVLTTATVGTLINGATEKTAPLDADFIPLMDSAASNITKKLSWAYVKSVLNTYLLSNTQTLTNKTLNYPKINENVLVYCTSTQLNILDGATLTTTELNYVDGVTSAIQTQLNDIVSSKAPKVATHSEVTNTYQIALADANTRIRATKSTAFTITIPLNATTAGFVVGDTIEIIQYGAGAVTIAIEATGTLLSKGSKVIIDGRYAAATITKMDTNTWWLVGALA